MTSMTPGTDEISNENPAWVTVTGTNTSSTYIGDPMPSWQPTPLYPMPPSPSWVAPGYTWTSPNPQIRQAHVTSDATVVNHCPFCGSGALVGRSDGGVDCNLCNETFRVSKQPMYSNMPSTQEGAGVESFENDPLTAEDPFEAPADAEVPVDEEQAVPAEGGEEDDEERGLPDFMSLKNKKGVPLDEDDFILHHALRSVRGE